MHETHLGRGQVAHAGVLLHLGGWNGAVRMLQAAAASAAATATAAASPDGGARAGG